LPQHGGGTCRDSGNTFFLLRLENCDVLIFEGHNSISELATVAVRKTVAKGE
jgi:hypothetical protein